MSVNTATKFRRLPTGNAVSAKLGQVPPADPPLKPCIGNESVHVRDLCVDFQSRDGSTVRRVDEVSFDLCAGEALGILGESGSGKTTTMLALLGLLGHRGRVVRGSCRFGATELIGANERELQKIRGAQIGFVFQEPSLALHPMMRVKNQLIEIFKAHRISEPRNYHDAALSALHMVFPHDAARIADSYPHQLSGGQQQRVLIAQALACRPKYLFADELTASLDSCTQQDILRTIQDCVQRLRVGLLIVSHNPAILARMAHRVLVMKEGRVIEYGPVREIFNSPRHPETRRLLSYVPDSEHLCPSYRSGGDANQKVRNQDEEASQVGAGSSGRLRQ
jgi:ABC-type glutathione transport system ATPase component